MQTLKQHKKRGNEIIRNTKQYISLVSTTTSSRTISLPQRSTMARSIRWTTRSGPELLPILGVPFLMREKTRSMHSAHFNIKQTYKLISETSSIVFWRRAQKPKRIEFQNVARVDSDVDFITRSIEWYSWESVRYP